MELIRFVCGGPYPEPESDPFIEWLKIHHPEALVKSSINLYFI